MLFRSQHGLRDVARRTGQTQAKVVRAALEAYIRPLRQPRPQSVGVGEDAGLAARDSEAWLSAHWAQR